MKRNIKSYIINIIPWALMLFSILFSMYFIKCNYYTLMNSDTASELVLGKLLSQEGGILSKNWCYSTEIKLLDVQILYKVFFMLFNDNWLLVRMCTSAVMLIFLAASYLFMMHSIGLYKLGLYTAFILLLPFSPTYSYVIIYGVFYNRVLILSFLLLGLVFRLLNESQHSKNNIIYLFLALISIISGFTGLRQAMLCFAPLVLTSLRRLYIDLKRNNSLSLANLNKKNILFFRIIAFSSCCYLIGFLFNKLIITNLYFSLGRDFPWNKFSISNLLDALSLFFDSFGQFEKVSLLRPFGISSVLSIFAVIAIFASVINLLKNIDNAPYIISIYTEFVIFDFFISLFLIAFTSSTTPILYWVPITSLTIPFWGLLFKYDKNLITNLFGRISIIVIYFYVVLSSLCTFLKPLAPQIQYSKDFSVYKNATAFLEENNYTEGFASFWLSDIITEMSSGKIEMWTTDYISDTDVSQPSSIYEWLQSKDHRNNLPQNRFFILTYNNDYLESTIQFDHNYYNTLSSQDENLIYSDDYARIYGFDNMDEFINLYKRILSSPNN
ncbi:hypothetical protein [Butyrivibrio sp.]|uniref:hypothetical protein n=1 Tax=Butyrivibrio sp. TaxID=28121 RepID=UPI0025C6A112|nr:hypothetical protein [Butyrivibrio sp.]MBE5837316.1 hypothetical protein [Butyrivibrio sp.]